MAVQAKPTAGVSYLVASASKQQGAPGSPPVLPHLVIRPPNLVSAKAPAVDQMLELIVEQVEHICFPHPSSDWSGKLLTDGLEAGRANSAGRNMQIHA